MRQAVNAEFRVRRVMRLERRVDPEILDNVPPDDPQAIRSRADLRRLNALMFNARTMSNLLEWCWRHDHPPERIVELGGGDATFTAAIARQMRRRWPCVSVLLVDRSAIVQHTTRRQISDSGWNIETVQADVFDFLNSPQASGADIVMANLFLHHFAAQALSRLLALSAGLAGAFAACEPRRNRFCLMSSNLVFALGANAVTRHDAPASVRAGFKDCELSDISGLREGWELREFFAPPFTHGFAARRAGSAGV